MILAFQNVLSIPTRAISIHPDFELIGAVDINKKNSDEFLKRTIENQFLQILMMLVLN